MGRMVYKFLSCTLFLVFTLVNPLSALAETFITNMSQYEVKTPAGLLKISKDAQAEYTFNLTLGDKRIARFSEYARVTIEGVYPSSEAAKLVLILLSEGGNVCDGFYKIAEIQNDGGGMNISDQFGSCNAIKDISFKGGAWYFQIPTFSKQGPETWVYRDGKITKLGKPEAMKPSNPDWQVTKHFENAVPDPKQREALIKKHGNVKDAYRAWLWEDAQRKIHPEQFRSDSNRESQPASFPRRTVTKKPKPESLSTE